MLAIILSDSTNKILLVLTCVSFHSFLKTIYLWVNTNGLCLNCGQWPIKRPEVRPCICSCQHYVLLHLTDYSNWPLLLLRDCNCSLHNTLFSFMLNLGCGLGHAAPVHHKIAIINLLGLPRSKLECNIN